jgi:phospholipid transport system substrate-binding protein
MKYASFLLILLLSAPFSMAQPATQASARAVIKKMTQEALAVLRNPQLTTAQKQQNVRDIADQDIDFETTSRLSMGRYWRELTEAQRAEFMKEFKEHISATHGHIIDEYVDEEVEITGDHQEDRGDWTVQTRIIGKKDDRRKEVAKVDYRLRQKDAAWKVIDVTIDGVSMVANFRAQFQDLMPNGGIERVLKLLREKNVDRKK